MDATELRVGNLLMFRDKKIVEVSNLGNTFETIELVNGLRYGSDYIEEYNPIKITRELLIEFGFKKVNNLGMFVYVLYIDEWLNFEVDLKHSTFHLVSSQENNDLNIDIGSYTVYRLIEIEFIHEIQNLYFALTAKELSLS